MAAHKSHMFIACVRLTYLVEETMRDRTINVFVANKDRKVTMQEIDQLRMAATQRIIHERGIQVGDIKEFVILNLSYLGHMTEKEFNNLGEAALANAEPANDAAI